MASEAPGDTAVLYNFPPNIDARGLRLALAELSVRHVVWGAAAPVGPFAVVRFTNAADAKRLIAGSAHLPPRSGAVDAFRVRIHGSPLCAIASPISVSGVKVGKPKDGEDGEGKKGKREPFKCRRCDEEGHKAIDCPNKAKDGKQGKGNKAAAGKKQAQAKRGDDDKPAEPPAAKVPKKAFTAEGDPCCKFCGSTEHVSRRCPNKAGGAAPAAHAPAAAAEPTVVSEPAAAEAVVEEVSAPRAARVGDACIHCGSDAHLSRKCPNRKQARPAGDDAAQQQQQQPPRAQPKPATPVAKPSAKPAAAAEPSPAVERDPCRICGGTDHVWRKCPKKNAHKPDPEPEPVVEAPPAPVVDYVKGETCKFCGSTSHLSRKCDNKNSGVVVVPVPAPAPVRVAPPVVAPPAPVVRSPPKAQPAPSPPQRPAAVASKPAVLAVTGDTCKYCGSNDHLSRKCPKKAKA